MPIPYLDAHCDTVTRGRPIRRCGELHLDLERLRAYGPAGQIMAIFAPPGRDGEDAFERLYAAAARELNANGDIAAWITSTDELDAAAERGVPGLLLSVEGANLLGCSVNGLRRGYEKGVRMVTLCWNEDNALCGSARGTGAGLKERGREFVRECFALGVAVDLSHASEKTFYDVLETAERPVCCSHSDARALCDHSRNLWDPQIRLLAENDGFCGLNLCTDFLGRGRDIDAVTAHAEHFLSLGMEKNLGLGTDFDGIPETPAGIRGVESMGEVYEAMLRKNWSEDLVRDIFYNNLHDYLRRAVG